MNALVLNIIQMECQRLPQPPQENMSRTRKSSKPENSLEKAATNILTSHIESAVNDLTSNIVGTAIEEVKNQIAPKRFMRRLCCSENLKRQ
jgi:hypothetical protein